MLQNIAGLYAGKGHKHKSSNVHVSLDVQAPIQAQEGWKLCRLWTL